MLAPGTTLGPYKILSPLGAGGMGEVYRARDTRLGRDVALKVIHAGVARDPDRIKRFEQEARAAGALSHPNVCAIYDIGTHDGSPFVVMELMEGESLREKLRAGALPVRKAIDYAAQAAHGLAAAHEKGIIHRDLKPENLFVTRDGRVKVLDFGLAKLTRPEMVAAAGEPTVSIAATETGAILGTVGYMSPEQVRGEAADARSDLFALGSIFYELLAGKRAFHGATYVETLNAILKEEPAPLSAGPRAIPLVVESIVRHCLEKSPEQRFQSASDLAFDLQTIGGLESGPVLAKESPGLSATWRWALLASNAVLLAAAAIAIYAYIGVRTTPLPVPHWKRLTFTGKAGQPALSPDGKSVAYVLSEAGQKSRLMIQDVAGGAALEVSRARFIQPPRWSPTGNEVLAALLDSSARTVLVPRMGGPPRVMPWADRGALSPDGSLLASAYVGRSSAILLRGIASQDTSSISLKGRFLWLRDLDWSPDGRTLLFVTEDESLSRVWTIRRDGTHQDKVHEDRWAIRCARWAPRGDAIYCHRALGNSAELIKVYVSGNGGRSSKRSRVLLSEPELAERFSLSQDGRRLVCVRRSDYSNLWHSSQSADARVPSATARQLTRGRALIREPSLSPDGNRVAYLSNESGAWNIHILSLTDNSTTQVTFLTCDVWRAAWSPDGRRIAFTASDGSANRVWSVATAGGAPSVYRRTQADEAAGLSWWPGRQILYERQGSQSYHILDPETEVERALVANDSVGSILQATWAPDGQHAAVLWPRSDKPPGLWVVSTRDSSQRLLCSGPWVPLRWDAAGHAVYSGLVDPPISRVLRFSYPTGDSTLALRLPFENLRDYDFSPDLRAVVYTLSEAMSDIWLVDNFDPEVK
jgi:Tol biopolymer transport system component